VTDCNEHGIVNYIVIITYERISNRLLGSHSSSVK
jgi:hypothetical protein